MRRVTALVHVHGPLEVLNSAVAVAAIKQDAAHLVRILRQPGAFRAGRAWGIQSHVEVTGDSLERMLAALDADPADCEPIVAALRRAEESADPPKARTAALLDDFAAVALGR